MMQLSRHYKHLLAPHYHYLLVWSYNCQMYNLQAHNPQTNFRQQHFHYSIIALQTHSEGQERSYCYEYDY